MPEGDTLFRTAVTLDKALTGRTVLGFWARDERLREVQSRLPVINRTVARVEARGKHLLIWFSAPAGATDGGELILHTHLRMTGSWHIYRPGERWSKPERRATLAITTDAFIAPCFSAPVAELLTVWQLERHPQLAALGPDAMLAGFDEQEALRRILESPDEPVGVALMRQRSLSGVGNVFKSEVLFLQRIDPFAAVGKLGEESLLQLIRESHRLLSLNRGGAPRQTRFTLQRQERLWVYGRSGRPCRECGGKIRMTRQGEALRSTYYCPVCQYASTGGARACGRE